MSDLILIHTVWKDYQKLTKVAIRRERVIRKFVSAKASSLSNVSRYFPRIV